MSQATATGLMELEHQRLNSLTTALSVALAEGFGDIVDQREWQNDDPTFGFGRSGIPLLYTTLNDRDDGKYLPIFQHQTDLQTIRAEARNVTAMSGGIMGAIGTLANYTLGGGLKFTAAKSPNCPGNIPGEVIQSLVAEAQRVIDQFLRENRFQSDMDREIDARAREDGEAFLELCVSPAGQIRASFDEPDMVCQPSDPRPIEAWLQDTDPMRYSPEWIWSWSFGVHCVRKTPDDPQGYHVVYDTAGSDWDYIPASRMLHVKRNVPRNVKRGVSDLYWIANDVQREAKIRRNTAAGAALQAAIAWVREHATGITPTAVSNMVTGNAVTTRTQRTTSGTQLRPGGKLREGTVVDIPENMKYLPGPMGAERNPNFILVAQYVSRAIAQRWAMPEFMFTSDASNANYASTLVAESPFTKARETDQRFYSQHFVELMWKVLRLAHEIGRAFSCCNRFEELMQILEITATGPRVSNRDEMQTVQRLQIEVAMGVTSLDTAAAELGRDLAKEQEKGAKPQAAPGAPGQSPIVGSDTSAPAPAASGEMLGQTMTERQRYMKNVLAIIDKLQAGMDPETARVMLDAQGVPPAKVQGILDRAAAGATDQEIVSDIGDQQTVTEGMLLECGGKGGTPGPCPSGHAAQSDGGGGHSQDAKITELATQANAKGWSTKQLKQKAIAAGLDPVHVRKAAAEQVSTGQAKRPGGYQKKPEGGRTSEPERGSVEDHEIEPNRKATHEALTKHGLKLVKESASGSRYYQTADGRHVRVADHAPNEATQQWIDNNDVHQIRVDKRGWKLALDQLISPVQESISESIELDVIAAKRQSRDFPKQVPTQEQILNESTKRLDELFDDLAAKTASGARKAELVEILKEIEDVKGQAALAAQVCGMLTPFKPTLQDGQSAQEAPVEPLAAIATDAKE